MSFILPGWWWLPDLRMRWWAATAVSAFGSRLGKYDTAGKIIGRSGIFCVCFASFSSLTYIFHFTSVADRRRWNFDRRRMDCGAALIGGWILLRQWIVGALKQFGVVALWRGWMDHGAELIEGWILLRRWVGRACERFGLGASFAFIAVGWLDGANWGEWQIDRALMGHCEWNGRPRQWGWAAMSKVDGMELILGGLSGHGINLKLRQ